MVRHPEVVVAEISDPFPARQLESSIVGGGLMAAIDLQVFPAEARIAKRGHDLRGIIRATVANYEHLKICESLGLRAEKRVTQDAAPIVGGDDDADEWRIDVHFTPSGPGNPRSGRE